MLPGCDIHPDVPDGLGIGSSRHLVVEVPIGPFGFGSSTHLAYRNEEDSLLDGDDEAVCQR